MTHRLRPLTLLVALIGAWTTPALAHPHVWVTAKAELVYDPDGKVTGVRHAWTFDKAYSAYITQGLDKNGDGKLTPDELKDLAKENTESLVEFDYFTVLKANGKKQDFGAPRDYAMAHADEAVTLSYFLPLRAPASAKTAALEIYDPTFFVAFSLAEGNDAVKLTSAPQGCATNITRAKAAEAAQQQNLTEAFFETLTASSSFGIQFANRAIVACP
ncbi:DUF1007 family protein [Microvirga subterranea]|uniref:ABC-type uncharacterized transport system substrate-binding protein n=1 Tax=Microvirga subterranea TaxID=186651 RepID=A0A370HHL5_9HYPH|nr:DUF1007 family protein [Microvirga subterranea]RDI57122.1 ABC-type uncharacterized transport system substrate-binding protein [Microvirga subterranea]